MRSETDDYGQETLDRLGKQLAYSLTARFVGRPMTKHTVAQISDVIKEHAFRARSVYGIKFPELVAIVLPSIGKIELVRADLDVKSIEQTIVNLKTKYPDASDNEMVWAIEGAFPDFIMGRLRESMMAQPKGVA